MLFFGIPNKRFRLILAISFAALSLICLSLMCWDYYVVNPVSSAPVGREHMGNRAGDFSGFATFTLIEFLILIIVLLPYSFSRFYWVRLLVLQFLFVGWFLLNLYSMMMSGLHPGNIYGYHLLYLLVVNAVIFILLVASIAAEIVARRKLRIQNNGTAS